jgi:hypothetical protein
MLLVALSVEIPQRLPVNDQVLTSRSVNWIIDEISYWICGKKILEVLFVSYRIAMHQSAFLLYVGFENNGNKAL